MTRKLLSPTQTLLFIQDMALQISSPLSSPPPLSSISPSVSRSDPGAFCMAIHMVLWAILCVCVCVWCQSTCLGRNVTLNRFMSPTHTDTLIDLTQNARHTQQHSWHTEVWQTDLFIDWQTVFVFRASFFNLVLDSLIYIMYWATTTRATPL